MRAPVSSVYVAIGSVALLASVVGATAFVGAASGCGPQCAGDKQGTAGCGCESDQDCATKNDQVFLCKSGLCEAGTPDAAPGAHCTDDAQCGDGGACGSDQVCIAVPKCQRVDEHAAPLSFLATGGATGALTASHTDCAHAWQASSGALLSLDVSVSIALDGTMTVADNGSNPACSAGVWSAANRIGAITCGATSWAIGPADAVAKACVDAASCAACGAANIAGDVGVCP